MEKVIEISNLTCHYKNQREMVLENFSMAVNQGELILIKGSNGSGKSTLISLLAGLDVSKLILNVDKIVRPNTPALVLQDPSIQFLTFSVKEELSTKLSYQFIKREKRKKQVQLILEKFNEIELKNQNPAKISSGQKQKVLILANIIDEPNVILLDEPFTYLDYSNLNQMANYILNLQQEGYTIIISTHLSILDSAANDIIYLDSIPNTKSSEAFVIRNERGENIYSIVGKIGYDKTLLDISIQFQSTGIYSILGKNGSGKTCLLLTLAGINDLLEGKMNFPDDIIFIPQRISYFFTSAKVRDELEGLEVPSWITNHLDKSPFHLSIGLQRILAIYIATKRFQVILIDEPFQSIDVSNVKFLIKLFKKERNNKLIIFSTNRELGSLGIQLDRKFVIKVE